MEARSSHTDGPTPSCRLSTEFTAWLWGHFEPLLYQQSFLLRTRKLRARSMSVVKSHWQEGKKPSPSAGFLAGHRQHFWADSLRATAPAVPPRASGSDAAGVGAKRCGAERRIRSGAMTMSRSVSSTNAIQKCLPTNKHVIISTIFGAQRLRLTCRFRPVLISRYLTCH